MGNIITDCVKKISEFEKIGQTEPKMLYLELGKISQAAGIRKDTKIVYGDDKLSLLNLDSRPIDVDNINNVIEAYTSGLNGIDAYNIGNAILNICLWENVEELESAICHIEAVIKRLRNEDQ